MTWYLWLIVIVGGIAVIGALRAALRLEREHRETERRVFPGPHEPG
jgi:hypothetical protein